MNDKKEIRVLVIDDEKVVRDFLGRFLKLNDIESRIVGDGLEAIEAAKKEDFDMVFLEIHMPKIDGPETIRELKKIKPSLKFVLMTACYTDDIVQEAKEEGISVCLKKPFVVEEIISEVNKVRFSE